MAKKEGSFISGLIGGFADTMDQQRKEKQDSQRAGLTAIIDSPDPAISWEDKQNAINQMLILSGLSPKGKDAETFHKASGMLGGIVQIGKGIEAGAKKITGLGGKQGAGAAQNPEETPAVSGYPSEETEIGNVPTRPGAGGGAVPQRQGQESMGMPQGTKFPTGGLNRPTRGSQYAFPTGVHLQSREQVQAQQDQAEQNKQQVQNQGKLSYEDQLHQKQKEWADKDYDLWKTRGQELGLAGRDLAEYAGSSGQKLPTAPARVGEAKDVYEDPKGSGNWYRPVLDAGGNVVNVLPAQAPKPALTQEDLEKKLNSQIKDVDSKIAARASHEEAVAAGLRDLTKTEGAEIKSLQTKFTATSRQLTSESAAQAKEGTTAGKDKHQAQIDYLNKQLDFIDSQIDNAIEKSKERQIKPPGGGGPAPKVPTRLPQGGGKPLTDKAIAKMFMDKVDGDPAKAHKLAEDNGWKVVAR